MSSAIGLVNEGNVIVVPPSVKDHGSKSASAVVNADETHQTKSGVLHRSLHQKPLRVVSATGHVLHLDNGQSIFDASSGAAVSCLGHGNERQV